LALRALERLGVREVASGLSHSIIRAISVENAIGQRPFDAASDCLMMHPKPFPDCKEREILTVAERHSRPFHPTRWLAARARNGFQDFDLFLGHRQLDRLPASCHDAFPRFV
jgi:hypothetical protein